MRLMGASQSLYRMMRSAVLIATRTEVRNFTCLTPEQAAVIRSRMNQTIKEGMDFGVNMWQKRLRQIAADPVLKRDIKEAVEFTAATWQQDAGEQ